MNKFELARRELKKICCYEPKSNCEQLFCLLHEPEYLGGHDVSHVCLACNLNDSLEKIYTFLSQNKSKDDIEYSFTIYILLLYLTVEKLHTVFKFVGITWDYVEENWQVLVEIRKWANFIKHPKGFLFTHHPNYVFETDEINRKDETIKFLDYEFVHKFYFREDEQKFKQTLKEIGNKDNITVILPCPDRIAKEFSNVCVKFCDKIKRNPHFKEVLKNHTLIEEY